MVGNEGVLGAVLALGVDTTAYRSLVQGAGRAWRMTAGALWTELRRSPALPHLHLTHDFLACMLGVRRVGITTAATALQDRQLITYHRGEVTVLDRAGLEAAACGCYRADRESFDALLG